MAEDYFVRQVTLEKPSDSGVTRMVTWIDEKGAKVGKRVELKDEEGNDRGPWEVVQVSDTRKHVSYLREWGYHEKSKPSFMSLRS